MAQPTANHAGRKRTIARLRAIRLRAAAWKRAARRAVALAFVAGSLVVAPSDAFAQMGQSGMAQPGGLVNGAVARLQDGPGWLYYGINAADRGLGYRGSYMTAGGFIPVAEDDLGGLWSTDLRGHLSNYGGFFSNVGAVRKQFIGGTLLGVGVYWDYDGDQNQYSPTPILGTPYSFAGGQSYNQVGVSGEWLTDWGNLRSNGYIPVGTTAQLTGPFVGNVVLCQNGVNAALGGADLEVGAYIPGLSDWAGMVSVGGYALGNTQYSFQNGTAAVPWFGGVYTRLDMTFIKNWDFSLQANNDSFFDWTGFARLTYRMGGSRRRNVPDQMEQPMMRNEHIVRARQVPETAINAFTGTPYRVFHVDNSATGAGIGTAESPFTTLSQAETAASAAYDIVYVHVGNSASSPYITPATGYTFTNTNQYLIGEGSTLAIPTLSCGNRAFFTGNGSGSYPSISNPLGTALVIDRDGTQVSHIRIVGSPLGISDGNGPGLAKPGVARVSDVIIEGAPGLLARGVEISKSTGRFEFDSVRLTSLLNSGFLVSATNADVSITNSALTDVAGTGIRVTGSSAKVTVATTTITGGTATASNAIDSAGIGSMITLTSSTISRIIGSAVLASGSGAGVVVENSRIRNTRGSALLASGPKATITATNAIITDSGTTGPAIYLTGVQSEITLASSQVERSAGVGVQLTGSDSTFTMQKSRLGNSGSHGISVDAPTGFARVLGGSTISTTGGNGILSTGTGLRGGGAIQVVTSTIENTNGAGILATGVSGSSTNPKLAGVRAVWVQGATINNAQTAGIDVTNSDLRVERADSANPASRQTRISNTGGFGVIATATVIAPATTSGTYNVLVDSAVITGVDNGITVAANDGVGVPTVNFTARNNSITTTGSGAGINLSAVWIVDPPVFPGDAASRVNASMIGNNISTSGTDDILLTTVGGPLQEALAGGGVNDTPAARRPISIAAGSASNLEGLNNGANVVSAPAATPPADNINFNSGLTVPPPPSPPPLP